MTNNYCFIIWSLSLFFLTNILGKRSDLPFSSKSDRKKEKSTVSFTHVQNIICSQTQLDGIAHEQTIICKAVICRSRGGLLTNEKKEKFASNDNVDYLPVKIKLTYILACLLDLAAKNRWTAVWLTAQSGNKPNAPPMTKVHIDRRWVGSGLRLFRGENKQLTSRKLLVHGTIKFAKMNHNFDYKARPVSIDLRSPSVAHSYTVSTGNHMILSAIRNR